jgi:cell division protein FtsA
MREVRLSDNIVGLDIGTSFVRAVIGEFTENGTLQILGVGTCVSTGLRNGLVVNIEATTNAIKEAIEAAEVISGVDVSSCVAAVGGGQINGLNSKGLVAIRNSEKEVREITHYDINRVIEIAKAISIPLDRQILHIVPQSYTVDGITGIKNPENMIGVRLEAEVHIITSAITPLQNIRRCITRAGYALETDGVMLKTLAATQAVMTEEELELGSILIDLGGGTTDMLVLYGGAPICTYSIPFGGINITNDIAIIKGVSFDTAEKIKLSSGCCWENYLEEAADQSGVTIPGVGGRPPEEISRLDLCGIIRPRVEEILIKARQGVVRLANNIDTLSGNIVLTGGGALMPGIVDLAQQIFDTNNVRIGYPGNLGGVIDEYRTPEYATAAGLFMSIMDRKKQLESNNGSKYTGYNGKNRENFWSGKIF